MDCPPICQQMQLISISQTDEAPVEVADLDRTAVVLNEEVNLEVVEAEVTPAAVDVLNVRCVVALVTWQASASTGLMFTSQELIQVKAKSSLNLKQIRFT